MLNTESSMMYQLLYLCRCALFDVNTADGQIHSDLDIEVKETKHL